MADIDLLVLPDDPTIPLTTQLWGKDTALASTPSNYPITEVIKVMSANAGTAVLVEQSGSFTIPALVNERFYSVVMLTTGTVTLPSPVPNVVLNVKAAPGAGVVNVAGNLDSTSSSTSVLPPGYSVQLHGGVAAWWIV